MFVPFTRLLFDPDLVEPSFEPSEGLGDRVILSNLHVLSFEVCMTSASTLTALSLVIEFQTVINP